MRKFVPVVLVLLLGIVLWAEKRVPSIKPIPVTPISQFLYFAVASENPGSVYSLNLQTKDVSPLYTRPSGQLFSFTFHPEIPKKLYFVNANDRKIFLVWWLRAHWSSEGFVYEHNTYIRDIAFGPEPAAGTSVPSSRLSLFFSEATEADGGRSISGGSPVLNYQVTVPWAGDFAFDEEGNRVPAKIYKVAGSTLQTIYGHNEPIKGFVVRRGKIHLANWEGSIYFGPFHRASGGDLGRNFRD